MTPEDYNRTVGLNLAITILETVKAMNRKGEEATNRTVSEAIAKEIGMGSEAERRLRKRVREQVRTLEGAGRLKRTERRDKHENVYYKTIEHVG